MGKAETREYVIQALFALLEKKELKDISVCELVEKAGISRATFYRNFLDMDQVVDEQLEQIAREITENAMADSGDIRASTLRIFQLLLERRQILNILTRRDMEGKIYRALYRTTVEHIEQLGAMDNRYQPHFFAGAACGMLIAWIRNGYKESPEEMVELLFGCLQGYVQL